MKPTVDELVEGFTDLSREEQMIFFSRVYGFIEGEGIFTPHDENAPVINREGLFRLIREILPASKCPDILVYETVKTIIEENGKAAAWLRSSDLAEAYVPLSHAISMIVEYFIFKPSEK